MQITPVNRIVFWINQYTCSSVSLGSVDGIGQHPKVTERNDHGTSNAVGIQARMAQQKKRKHFWSLSLDWIGPGPFGWNEKAFNWNWNWNFKIPIWVERIKH